MFPARYFAARHFAPRYWPKVGSAATNALTGIWSKVITIQAKRERVELKRSGRVEAK